MNLNRITLLLIIYFIYSIMSDITIPNYPILYKDKNGKIYQWSIEIKKIKDDVYQLIYAHGQKDGKITPHYLDISQGKQKRTVLEQAIMEANKRWNDKKEKELYEPNDDPSSTSHHSSEKSSKKEAKEKKIVVRPMLAKTFDPTLYDKTSRAFKISFDPYAYVQRKLDGIRCIAYLNDKNDVVLESRTGIKFENFDLLRSQLKPMLETLGKNVYLDGELYTNKIPFQEISGYVRKSKEHATPEDIEKINLIEYHIYDIVTLNNPDLTFEERMKKLILLEKKYNTPIIQFVETIKVKDHNDVQSLHDQFVQEGFEGLMVRDRLGPYEINKRSKYLQKFKSFDEDEFEITGYHAELIDDGSENQGKKMVVWECITKDKIQFSARPSATNEERMKLYQDAEKYLGKKLTVKYFGFSEEGIPRFPVGKDIRENY